MIRIAHGSLLSSSAQYICHQVCVSGGMNSRIAKEITVKWPMVYRKYQQAVRQYEKRLLGNVQYVRVGECKTVATIYAESYNDLFRTFSDISERVSIGDTIAMPYRIASGTCGSWGIILDMLSDLFKDNYLILYKETKNDMRRFYNGAVLQGNAS